jgi:hypothetical protein
MNVFGHHYISIDTHREATAHAFKTNDEQGVCLGIDEFLFTSVTAESNEVRLSGLMKAPETRRHELTLVESVFCAKLRRLSLYLRQFFFTQVSATAGANLGHPLKVMK